MPMSWRLLRAVRKADQRRDEVPSTRQTSSSLTRNWNVWSGLLRSYGLEGKSDATRLSPTGAGSRSTKFGVKGKTRNGLVPALSLFESPRLDRLCVPLRLTESENPPPSSWSTFERSDCFL